MAKKTGNCSDFISSEIDRLRKNEVETDASEIRRLKKIVRNKTYSNETR